MIVAADYKAIEWQGAIELSGDPVGIDEWNSGVDMHQVNKDKFNLPERRIAKIFLFRLIFGGNEWSYAHDPDYSYISDSTKYWRKVIDAFKDKYHAWDRWVADSIQEAIRKGYLVSPTGRVFYYTPVRKRGELVWPINQIMNYRVQGTASDWVRTGRVVLKQKLDDGHCKGSLMVNSVHDSLVLDVPDNRTECALRLLYDVVHNDTQKVFSQLFKYRFRTNIKGEVFFGPNQSDLEEWKP